MLRQLLIRQFVLVEELSLSLAEGLTVLTGETGAGKSIVVDALAFLLGERADRELIRAGSDKAYVEGLFELEPQSPVFALLAQMSLDVEEQLLPISRELSAAGKSVCRVGGIAVSLAQLKKLSAHLLDIHGQHDHQALLDEGTHIRFVDAYGCDKHAELVQKTAQLWQAWRQVQNHEQTLRAQNSQLQERLELLRLQEKELSQAKLRPNEEEELSQTKARLRNRDKFDQAVQNAYSALAGIDRAHPGAVEMLQGAQRALEGVAGLGDAQLLSLQERLGNTYYELDDIALMLRTRLENAAREENNVDAVEERLDLLKRLGRKYGADSAQLIAKLATIQADLARFATMDEALDEAEKQLKQARAEYDQAAGRLSRSRRALVGTLEKKMEAQLQSLQMVGSQIAIALAYDDQQPLPTGYDHVRIQIASNAGEGTKPLAKVASGGELSRLMLALKSVAAAKTEIPSMVFDEIDTGISGHAAQAVAEKLWDIARWRQVICVTHLQQIAAMASQHYLIEKKTIAGRTSATATFVQGQARQEEIARLIGGLRSHRDSSMAHAQAMLEDAAKYRQKQS